VAACGPTQAEQDAKLCRIAAQEAAAADRRSSLRTGGSGEPETIGSGLARVMEESARGTKETLAAASSPDPEVRANHLAKLKADAAKARADLEAYKKISAEERAVATANVARRMGMTASAIEASYERTGCLRP
jgi:hypothetical protein